MNNEKLKPIARKLVEKYAKKELGEGYNPQAMHVYDDESGNLLYFRLRFNLLSTRFFMALLPKFFRSIDPTSEESGIKYSLWPGHNGQEMMDQLPMDYLKEALKRDHPSLFIRLMDTYKAIVGSHGGFGSTHGCKGFLDFLIFPLIARKIIGDTLSEGIGSPLCIGVPIAIGLELIRIALALALTVALSPFVAIGHGLTLLSEYCTTSQDNTSSPRV